MADHARLALSRWQDSADAARMVRSDMTRHGYSLWPWRNLPWSDATARPSLASSANRAGTLEAGRLLAFLLVLFALTLLPAAADAQAIDQTVQTFVTRAAGIQRVTQTAAEDIFLALVIIDFVWVVGWTAVGSGELFAVLSSAVKVLLAAAFFWWLLENGAVFGTAIIQGFAILGGQASQAMGGLNTISPSDVFGSGIRIVGVLWDLITALSISALPLDILYVIAGAIVLVIFAFLAGMLVEVIVESALMTMIGLILLGFGGTSFTREHAITYYRFCLSVGMKRLVLQAIVGIGTGSVAQLAFDLHTGLVPPTQTIALIVAIPLVIWQLAQKLPYRAQDIINGQVSHGGNHMFSTALIAGAGIGAAASNIAGMGAAAGQAVGLAREQAAEQVAAGGERPGMIGMAGMAGRNFANAAIGDVGTRLGSQRGWRIAANIRNARS